jgi:PPOX class probable F420-dependent enzyme
MQKRFHPCIFPHDPFESNQEYVRRRAVPDSTLAWLGDQKYISLETFKKNGEGVKTPVWFVLHDGALYLYTEATSWKVKRIRNNPRVRVAPCSVRGVVKGPWVEATASIIDGDERRAADKLLDRKYFMKVILNLLTKLNRHERAMIKIVAA